MTRQRIISLVLLIFLIGSIGVNLFLFLNLKKDRDFLDSKFRSDFGGISQSIDLFEGVSLTNETAIKNSVEIVSSLSSIYPYTSYKENKELGQMLFNLKKFMVLESNKKVNDNTSMLKDYLTKIENNLDNKALIAEFSNFLVSKTAFPMKADGAK